MSINKEKIVFQELLPFGQFQEQIEISRTFIRAKQVGEKRARFQSIVEISLKADLIVISL